MKHEFVLELGVKAEQTRDRLSLAVWYSGTVASLGGGIGVDLAGILRGRMASTEGRCRMGWGMVRGVPSPAD